MILEAASKDCSLPSTLRRIISTSFEGTLIRTPSLSQLNAPAELHLRCRTLAMPLSDHHSKGQFYLVLFQICLLFCMLTQSSRRLEL
jgi:hypothetical protein